MIDLGRGRPELLREIDAAADLLERPCVAAEDPDLGRFDEAHLSLAAHTRDELFPRLRDVLCRYFDRLPREQLAHDVLRPLRRALGNAYKRGNGATRDKWIRVELGLTRRGLLIEVRDEGSGFDVASVLERFRRQQRYFDHGGAGMRSFDSAACSVSYADGGRTFLLGYRCSGGGSAGAGCETARDEVFMLHALRAELPLFKKTGAKLASLRITPLAGAPAAGDLRYRLHARDAASGREEVRCLSARVLPPEEARSDYAVARALARGPFRGARGLRVAEPMAAFKAQPQVVLYPLEADADLRGHLDALASRSAQLSALAAVGEGLRRLHGCGFAPVRSESVSEAIARGRRRLGAWVGELASQGNATAARRALRLAARLEAGAARPHDALRLPIHGSFGFDCLVREGAQLFLQRFEHVRAGHPGLDLGAFLLDLAGYAGAHGARFHADARAAFLAGYGAAPWHAELPLFALLAALARLEQRGAGGVPDAAGFRSLELAGLSPEAREDTGFAAGT